MIKILKEVFRIPERWPSFGQTKSLPKVLNKKEAIILLISFYTFIFSLVFLVASFYFRNTTLIPRAGGIYVEGVVGSPRFINPVYSLASDVDRDITQLVFSGIAKYGSSGEIIPDLAESIEQRGNVFEVRLREDIFWSDGERITSDDILFTIRAIQDPDYKSPLRPDWIGIGIEKTSDLSVNFILEEKSAVFWNKLVIKIIPRHIWEDITPQNFSLSHYNLNPVGSGPFKVSEVVNQANRVTSIKLDANSKYHGRKPYLEGFTFIFFETRDKLISAGARRKISGLSITNPEDRGFVSGKFIEHIFSFPRYFAVFFNNENEKLSKDLRQALNFAIDKENLIDSALMGGGIIVNSPMLSEIYGFGFESRHEFNIERSNKILDETGFIRNHEGMREKIKREDKVISLTKDLRVGAQGEEVRDLQRCLAFISESDSEIYPEKSITGFYGAKTRDAVNRFQEKYADEILAPSGFSRGTGMVAEQTRIKLNELCGEIPGETEELSLTITTVNQPLTLSTAHVIKEQWERLGIRIDIESFDLGSLEREVIKPRNFEALIFGKAFEPIPDPFPFWHSSQKTDLGLNLSMFESERADKLLEEIRRELDPVVRSEKMMLLEEEIIESVPAVFLYSPDYLYLMPKNSGGVASGMIVNPSFRFLNIENWYLRTKRVWNKKS